MTFMILARALAFLVFRDVSRFLFSRLGRVLYPWESLNELPFEDSLMVARRRSLSLSARLTNFVGVF